MPSLWFVVPVHGRVELARICLRQLRRTCDALTVEGVDASAVIVGNDKNLATARELGFATYRRDNRLSKKFNDGIQCALDPKYNPRPADYVVPCGSDDWVDHRLFLDLPPQNTVVGFQRTAFVREDGMEIEVKDLRYPGGSGIRIYPRDVLAGLGYRPAAEDRSRGCDTSILHNVQLRYDQEQWRFRLQHWHLHDFQIVDWKTTGTQLNAYADLGRHRGIAAGDPFEVLAGIYPEEALEEMAAHYERVAVAA
jgi:hypothetical protein